MPLGVGFLVPYMTLARCTSLDEHGAIVAIYNCTVASIRVVTQHSARTPHEALPEERPLHSLL